MTWNTPEKATDLAEEVKGWLITADPEHSDYYNERYEAYVGEIVAAGQLSADEMEAIPGQKVISMIWQKDAAENWLGLDVVDIYAPDFYMKGAYTAVKLIDRINGDPEAYKDVAYVIENMQSGELGKGVEEALTDKGYAVERVVFTNFPKSVDGVDSIPDVLAYNKNLVLPAPAEDSSATDVSADAEDAQTEPTQSPGFGVLTALAGIGAILCARKCVK
jgi:zinc/manganese transport system substrate-binding protein